MLVQFLLLAALAFLVAGLVPYVPDVRIIADNILSLQFLLSGIFYSAERVPEEYREWFLLNPMAALINDYRSILLLGDWPDWSSLALFGFLSSAVLLISVFFILVRDLDYPRIVR
jgi:lipopolysaccharide transport system permease protein